MWDWAFKEEVVMPTKPGQPTKYKKEFCKQMIEFFNAEPFEDREIPHYKNGEVAWNDVKRLPNKLPTMVQFARDISVCISTVYNWLDSKHDSHQPEFLETYTRIAKRLQKDFIIQNGLQGISNPIITKFVAVNLTDMRDTQVKEMSGEVKHNHGLTPELQELLDKEYE